MQKRDSCSHSTNSMVIFWKHFKQIISFTVVTLTCILSGFRKTFVFCMWCYTTPFIIIYGPYFVTPFKGYVNSVLPLGRIIDYKQSP